MRRTKEDAEITRQQLLKAATKVFAEKGYAATRLSDIADEANVTRGAIYWHFENKKNLFIALFKERVSPIFELVAQAIEENNRPLAKIEKLTTVLFDKMACDQEIKRDQQLEFMEMKVRGDFPEIKEYMKAHAEKLNSAMLKIIIAGMESGEIRTDISPQAICSTLVTSFIGFGHLQSDVGPSPVFKGYGKENIDILMKGIRAN